MGFSEKLAVFGESRDLLTLVFILGGAEGWTSAAARGCLCSTGRFFKAGLLLASVDEMEPELEVVLSDLRDFFSENKMCCAFGSANTIKLYMSLHFKKHPKDKFVSSTSQHCQPGLVKFILVKMSDICMQMKNVRNRQVLALL